MKKILFVFFMHFALFSFGQQKKDSVPKYWNINGKLTFLFNQSTFSNWVAGGSNTIAGNVAINYEFNYKKNRWSWDNKFVSSYGLSYVDEQGTRKTDDGFEYTSTFGLKSGKHWFFSFINNFRSQYTIGYDYKQTPEVAISDFLSPAYWSFGLGMLWKKSDNEQINIAPATSRFTFVSNEFSGKYGVKEGDNTAYSLGFNLSAYFKLDIMKNVKMEHILAMYADYLNKPQNVDIDYQLRFFVKVNKYLSTNLGFHIIVDDNASKRIQFKQVFGLGLNYIFHKK